MVTYSIITPTFNRRGVIVRSIESSLAFIRLVRNAELVVIDDASRDGTVELLCGRYADEIACGVMTLRVRSTNGGVTAARNDGITAAHGAWLIFIDSRRSITADGSVGDPGILATAPGCASAVFPLRG